MRSPVQRILLAVAVAVAADAVATRACGLNGALVETCGAGWRELAAPTSAHLFVIAASRAGWYACGLAGALVPRPG